MTPIDAERMIGVMGIPSKDTERALVADAVMPAERFIQRVDRWQRDDHTWMPMQSRAAMHRASMDLTRALAAVRRGSE